MKTTEKQGCNALVEILVKQGVKRAVLSPGSRNAPVLMAFSRCEAIESYVVVDERTAAFMALGMMLPGMAAGWLQELIGYKHFFYWVMICCAATIAVCAFIKIDPNYGKKDANENETVTKLKTYAKQMRNAHYLIINEK